MKAHEERVRFCDHCNAVIGWYAEYCDECGAKSDPRGTPRPAAGEPTPARDLATAEKDLFKAHLRLIHRSREQAEQLGKNIDRVHRSAQDIERRRPSPETRRALLGLSERVLEMEQEWEEIQRSYNNQSESIEEEFLERIEELEADLELSPEHQQAVEKEVDAFLKALEALDARLRETAHRIDLVTARHKSRVFGLSTGVRGTLVLGVIAFGLAAGGALWGVFVAKLPVRDLGISLIPAWIGICALFLNARAKSI